MAAEVSRYVRPHSYIRVTARRWVSDEPFPGLVEVLLQDAWGKAWKFIDKAPMFDEFGVLDRQSIYPIQLEIACTVLGVRTTGGQDVVQISTADPWGLETVEGTYVFEVAADQIAQAE
jgi:hypothetical protein